MNKTTIEPTDVRDLEQEGVMGHASWSAGVQEAFGNAARDIRIRGLEFRVEKLEEDKARLQEVLADLLKERKNQKENNK